NRFLFPPPLRLSGLARKWRKASHLDIFNRHRNRYNGLARYPIDWFIVPFSQWNQLTSFSKLPAFQLLFRVPFY
ncbi:MAG: hypothetical protein LBB05_04290, partial [Puniceicoccales bacterium]|nr:hypothetical protein [Puniceicoccales bacterium]